MTTVRVGGKHKNVWAEGDVRIQKQENEKIMELEHIQAKTRDTKCST